MISGLSVLEGLECCLQMIEPCLYRVCHKIRMSYLLRAHVLIVWASLVTLVVQPSLEVGLVGFYAIVTIQTLSQIKPIVRQPVVIP